MQNNMTTLESKYYSDHNNTTRYQTPTQAFISHSMRIFTDTHSTWNNVSGGGGESCRRYHGIMKRFTDAEREMRIKTTRKAFGKAHLMAVKEANKPTAIVREHRMSSTVPVLLDKRQDVNILNESMGVGEMGVFKTRRNSSVRLSAPNNQQQQRQSTAMTSSSVKLPRMKSALVLNSSLSLHDLSPQPKPNQLHLISSMSREAQYSMLRSYEQLIRDELLLLKMSHDDAGVETVPTTPQVGDLNNNHNQHFFSTGSVNPTTLSYLITPFRSSEECEGFFRDSGSNSQDNETIEIRKLKMTHFMEIAIKILNLIQMTRRLDARKNDPNYARYHDRLSSTTPSVFDDDDPFELFSRWAYLLNKEFKS